MDDTGTKSAVRSKLNVVTFRKAIGGRDELKELQYAIWVGIKS